MPLSSKSLIGLDPDLKNDSLVGSIVLLPKCPNSKFISKNGFLCQNCYLLDISVTNLNKTLKLYEQISTGEIWWAIVVVCMFFVGPTPYIVFFLLMGHAYEQLLIIHSLLPDPGLIPQSFFSVVSDELPTHHDAKHAGYLSPTKVWLQIEIRRVRLIWFTFIYLFI